MSSPIAKQLLIRWAETEATLEQYRPAVREFVYAMDTGNVFMGTQEGPKKIAYWTDVQKYVQTQVQEYKPKTGNNDFLTTNLLGGQIGFNTDIKRLQYLDALTNVRQTYVTTADMPLKDAITVKVTSDNIDSNDNNSVTITNFKRPIRMIFVNGLLVSNNTADSKYYKYDASTNTLKIYNMEDGDLIAYF